MEIVVSLSAGWLVFSAGMLCAWMAERITVNAGWIDVVWTLSLSLAAIVGASVALPIRASADPLQIGATSILLLAWTARLAGHLTARSARVTDDPRYAKLRREWGIKASYRLFFMLQAQAFFSLPLVLSLIMAATAPGWASVIWVVPGILTSTLGVLISWSADRDLVGFKRTANGLCTHGLWRYSRHPNYFGEIVYWMGVALLSIPWGWVGLLATTGPITMYILLRFISGVPPLEEHLENRYGADFTAYRETTPAIIPRFGCVRR